MLLKKDSASWTFNWFFMTPSIATKFQYINSPFIFFVTHYMFRPLRAIFRWDIQLDILRTILIQRIRCTYTIWCIDVICCTLVLWLIVLIQDRLCGLVVRVLDYRSEGPGSILATTRKKNVVGLERGPLSLVSTTEELVDRKVAAPI
jgi:hypothetical protein